MISNINNPEETIKAYNNFLYHATGFTAKERAKRLKKQAMKEEI